jgi:hypothetical protein
MSPSILQLTATGVQDIYLTVNPEINVFKYKYYRYVNFATDIVKIHPNEGVNFGKKFSIDIPIRGHLLSKLNLHIKLPPLEKNGGTYACWADTLAFSILAEPIELEIGGVIVERLYPNAMDIKEEFTNQLKRIGRNQMLLRGDTYVSSTFNAIKPIDLVIPLEFWFSKEYKLALPLVAMSQQNLRINMKFKLFSECVNYDGIIPPAPVDIISTELYGEYIFLDESIIEQYRTQKHQYIVDFTQFNGVESISPGVTDFNTLLRFNHPIKELLFGCVSKENIENNNYFNYSSETSDAFLSEAGLQIEGKYRFEMIPEFYYRQVFPDKVHSTIPSKYIYSMPFCLKPEQNQPTGSINFNQFNDTVLNLRMKKDNPGLFLFVYAVSINIITIENGLLTIQFTV